MEASVVAKQIRPFWGRVSVVESPVDESERASGLIVPHSFDGDDSVKRGVVIAIDLVWDENTPGRAMADVLVPGTPVYFQDGAGIRIRDVLILEINHILAFEADE